MALHILVVEDDATVLTMLVVILEDAGFTVTAADGGLAMREILAAEKPPIDAVVLDCRMHGEPSAQLALQAKSLCLPVVMISGHIEGDAIRRGTPSSTAHEAVPSTGVVERYP